MKQQSASHGRPELHLSLRKYLAAVSIVGLALLVVVITEQGLDFLRTAPTEFWLLAALLLLSETVKVPHHDEITSSTPFAFGLLLIVPGVAPAMIAQTVASIGGDLQRRKTPMATAFNVAQQAIALGGAGATLALLTDVPRVTSPPFEIVDMPAIMIAGGVYFVLNNVLSGIALALSEKARLIAFLRRDLSFQLLTEGAQLSLAPLIVLAVTFDPLMLLLMIFPLLAVHKGGQYATLSAHQALHDSLTGLPNRLAFSERVEEAVTAQRRRKQFAVMIMDLDHFKQINDTLGHQHGDLLLESVAQRMQNVLRDTDTVARMGGDEFAVLLNGITGQHDALVAAEKILTALQQPVELDGLMLEVGASIGIACCPDHGEDLQTLLQHADVAMYVAKRSGSKAEVYEREHDETSPRRLALASELRGAIEAANIVLHYQPIAAMADGRLQGLEALARWRHPKRGLLPPDEFIPLAEQSGLIKPLTMALLREALTEIGAMRRDVPDLSMAVNISPRHLSDQQLPTDLEALLAESGADPSWLKLEVTESTVMSDPRRAEAVLSRLHSMGVRLAIDDFGTGHSSLELLRRLPVEEIKIDKSFVKNMTAAVSDGVIVRSTIDLGHNLGLTVLAEGVETAAAWDQLSELGCDLAQGYLLSRPMPVDEARRWVGSYRPDRHPSEPATRAGAVALQ